MKKVTIYDKGCADNYFENVAVEAEKRGFVRFDENLDDYVLLASWEDVDDLREELRRSEMKRWEDRFIFGEPGYWYVIIGGMEAGYFSRLMAARRFVRNAGTSAGTFPPENAKKP